MLQADSSQRLDEPSCRQFSLPRPGLAIGAAATRSSAQARGLDDPAGARETAWRPSDMTYLERRDLAYIAAGFALVLLYVVLS